MPHVISASRRTDIPAFYSDWFANRLKAGHAYVLQPYSRKPMRVSLKPGDVSAIVFWSKNYSPILGKLDRIEKNTRNLFFHFTITANNDLELFVPAYRDAIKDCIFLSNRYSPEQVVWRFDPICITDRLSFEIHMERFTQCAEMLKGHVYTCYISFVHPYKKVMANFLKYSSHSLLDIPVETKRAYARRFAESAEKYGIRLFACCNDFLLSGMVGKASCINGRDLSRIFGAPVDARAASTRKECACTKSIDIGAYDTCAHGCLYCYANTDKNKARDASHRHDPRWNALTMQVDEDGVEASRKQYPLFK